ESALQHRLLVWRALHAGLRHGRACPSLSGLVPDNPGHDEKRSALATAKRRMNKYRQYRH
ncbi:MAG TPA: hypothetical protein VN637_06665, partial [Roseiarcus sp.]|nr:hypothetical protein [Roseiarcus sp.]